MKPYDLALIQMAARASKDESLKAAGELVREAAGRGAGLVCLPELFATPYFCQTEEHAFFDLAEPANGPTVTELAKVAGQTRTTLVIPFFERRAPGLYHNSLAVAGPDGEALGLYRKMHIPDDPGYYEKFYFAPGDTGFKSFDTAVGPVGTLICWDQWFPEAARLTALAGAMLIVYPTAIGWHPAEKTEYGAVQREAWQLAQRAHALSSHVFTAAVNRVGHEIPPGGGAGIEFWGSSFVAGPMGEILAQASTDKEEILTCRIDPKQVETTRRHWPFLRDRRIDAYAGISRRFADGDR
ncbi:MAG: carbon-nitrogen hydrolase [Desulfovibrionaceae bacterium]|nr:carbon-nitrogen hydrolase [Desulfovibrionaceae bacterium]